ncbi:DUF5959 family protein [Streptomyces massasporeus]|uniref:DUF5959 family protein n=1 Tax=Streptomyces massasporeus TaxID=67324 RepID=UPI0034D430C1
MRGNTRIQLESHAVSGASSAAIGRRLRWRCTSSSSGPSIFIELADERDCPEIVVEDESGSMVTVQVPLGPPDDWIADHQQRLQQVERPLTRPLRLRRPLPLETRSIHSRGYAAFH